VSPNKLIHNKDIKEKKMIKTMLVRKLGLGILMASVSLFCAQSQAAIIASYAAGADLKVSATSSDNEFFTELFFTDIFLNGLATGDASGSGDSAVVTLGAGEFGAVSAAAEGEADVGGFTESRWDTDAYFFFENPTDADLTVDFTFDISWFASIFTTSADEEAYATAGVYIEDSFGEIVFADFIEVDSLDYGVGTWDERASFSFDISVTIAAFDYEEFFLNVDAFGFAGVLPVPEPSSVFLAGLAFMFAVRKRHLSMSAK
jgi:hypothetical protein